MKGGKSKADTSKKADAKLSVKRKAAETVSKPVKKGKAGKDPNKSKRPPSAFFIFMEEFRKQFKEKNPNNKQVSVVGKAAGAKWKSMSAAEKAPYEAKATKRKAEYNKTMDAYNKQSDGAGKKSVEEEEESDKSKSEVHDEDDEESGEPARMEELRITKPDDWHLHLRDGDLLQAVAPHSASHFGRAIVMPNLKPPVTTTAAAVAYRERILRALPPDCGFEPLMTLYLTDNTSPREIELARRSGVVYAVKLYPAGATTNSQDGVTDIFGKCLPVLEQMIDHNMPLLVHGEVTDPNVDTFDREKVFIETILAPLVHRLPQLKIVMEHITTMDAVNFVESCTKGSVAATVTPQHLLLNRNSLFQGGLQPHNYCLPVLKRETHRQAIEAAVTSGSRRFFLGTDSAPHERRRKECSFGCAGIYSAPVALSLYAKVFEQAGALDKLEAFVSFNGPDFYGLPKNTSKGKSNEESLQIDPVEECEPASVEVSNSIICNEDSKAEEELAQWWGHKYGFISGGFLGVQSRTCKSVLSKDSQSLSSITRKAFVEQDQENLYNLVQDNATSGKQGLGIKDQPKKVAGCYWKGKRTSFSDNDGEISADSSGSTKRKRSEDLDTTSNPEPRTRLKKLCKQLLCQVPSHSSKLKKLKLLVEAHSGPVFAKFSSKCEALSYLKKKLEASRSFHVDGKKVSLLQGN